MYIHILKKNVHPLRLVQALEDTGDLDQQHLTKHGGTDKHLDWTELLPSGKHTKNYWKSLFLIGKSTITMAIFNSKLLVYQRVNGDVTGGNWASMYRRHSDHSVTIFRFRMTQKCFNEPHQFLAPQLFVLLAISMSFVVSFVVHPTFRQHQDIVESLRHEVWSSTEYPQQTRQRTGLHPHWALIACLVMPGIV